MRRGAYILFLDAEPCPASAPIAATVESLSVDSVLGTRPRRSTRVGETERRDSGRREDVEEGMKKGRAREGSRVRK
jgi:hypothetical protein